MLGQWRYGTVGIRITALNGLLLWAPILLWRQVPPLRSARNICSILPSAFLSYRERRISPTEGTRRAQISSTQASLVPHLQLPLQLLYRGVCSADGFPQQLILALQHLQRRQLLLCAGGGLGVRRKPCSALRCPTPSSCSQACGQNSTANQSIGLLKQRIRAWLLAHLIKGVR